MSYVLAKSQNDEIHNAGECGGAVTSILKYLLDEGLVDEVRSVQQYRDLAALQTVGYKEIFDWFDYEAGLVSTEGWGPTTPGDGPVTSLDRAVELIQRNTRHYAKRQLSYWKRDPDIQWMEI